MSKNEENKDARIATSSRGLEKSEDQFLKNLRIEGHRTEDRGFKPNKKEFGKRNAH